MTLSIHVGALSPGGVFQAEMPRAPCKLKAEGSEEAGQRPAVGLVRKKIQL